MTKEIAMTDHFDDDLSDIFMEQEDTEADVGSRSVNG